MNFKLQISNVTFLSTAYGVGILILFLYSFTQVDLGLTLTRATFFQTVQTAFQYIGYFNRPLSTYLFIGIICYLYLFYAWILIHKKNFSLKAILTLITISSIVLAFSYTAFSYDIFNYIFDAKIWTYYGKNPYEFKALDFPQEPMLAFMHWTHRVYPYGPAWLLITIPVSYIGLGYFLLTYFLFKAIMLASFLGTIFFIKKILEVTSPKNVIFGVTFFGLNPFVLIESLVSAHNDIVMLFFFISSIYFLVRKQYILTFLLVVFGYGIKFASASYALPIHISAVITIAFGIGMFSYIQQRMKINWEIVFILIGLFMILPVVVASMRTNFQPWYYLSIMPFAALAGKKYPIILASSIMSFIVLFEYVPYLYIGNWNPPVPQILQGLTVFGIAASLVLSLGYWYIYGKKKHIQ